MHARTARHLDVPLLHVHLLNLANYSLDAQARDARQGASPLASRVGFHSVAGSGT
jgi:hypothetical protein